MLSNLPNAKWIIWEKFRGHLCAWISACKEWWATIPLSKSHCVLMNNYLAPGTNAYSCGCLHLSWNCVLSCKMAFLLQPEHIQWKEFNITSVGRWFHCWKTVTIGCWSKIDSDLPSFNWNPLICVLYFGTAAGVATIRTKKAWYTLYTTWHLFINWRLLLSLPVIISQGIWFLFSKWKTHLSTTFFYFQPVSLTYQNHSEIYFWPSEY